MPSLCVLRIHHSPALTGEEEEEEEDNRGAAAAAAGGPQTSAVDAHRGRLRDATCGRTTRPQLTHALLSAKREEKKWETCRDLRGEREVSSERESVCVCVRVVYYCTSTSTQIL